MPVCSMYHAIFKMDQKEFYHSHVILNIRNKIKTIIVELIITDDIGWQSKIHNLREK